MRQGEDAFSFASQCFGYTWTSGDPQVPDAATCHVHQAQPPLKACHLSLPFCQVVELRAAPSGSIRRSGGVDPAFASQLHGK